MGKFVIAQRKNGEFQFNLLAGNGQVILTSEGYSSPGACVTGINSVVANCHLMHRYEIRESQDGKFYFVLKAGNGQVLGTSETYETRQGAGAGISSVMENGQTEEVEDLAG